MSNNIRQNFYQGQNVLAKDLNNLQAYSDKNRNILVSDLLGTGILNGFEVTHKKDLTFSVSPGVAFDGNGNRFILEESTDVVLAEPVYIDGKSEPILIGIKHSYIESIFVKDSQDEETSTILTPSVKFITDETPEENFFQIATITLNENTDPLITRGEIFIALPDLTNTVATNKTEIDSKVDDNTLAIATTNTAVATNKSAITTTNTEINKKVTDLTNTVATTNTAVTKNTSAIATTNTAVATNKSAITTTNTAVATNKSAITTTNTAVTKNTSGVASNKTSINKLNSVLSNSYGNTNISGDEIYLRAPDSIILESYTPPSSASMSRGITLRTDQDIHLNPDNNGHVKINNTPIIETGPVNNTSNGTYTKFYDGTMICNLDTTDISKGTKWNFPATFTTEPIIIGFQYEVFQESSSFWKTGYNISSITESTLKTSFTETGGSAYAVRLKISVMGRWKAFPKTTQ